MRNCVVYHVYRRPTSNLAQAAFVGFPRISWTTKRVSNAKIVDVKGVPVRTEIKN